MSEPTSPRTVLVICTGNSCRSIIAEALINALPCGRYRAVSAGSAPTGTVHPGALAVLKRRGIDPGRPRSQSWKDFITRHFDVVVTVCDRAAGEACPVAVGDSRVLHWSLPDPAAVHGTHDEIEQAFDAVFDRLKQHIDEDLQ
ncbi:arsenate reductase ArsC [Wenzhouxiangella sp. XN79A]|uniref:arsenate reductase ArsC n=1 Tax=Wenzhouxiangella sp. XN79A TaxID=2724193 RepID=UPI00144A586F|nr:arsenate reductase ArsC [Wenzhouxiangella sp. XN79A]NKI36164.1 arsenate reductase ArsC [Wenzhouxiangella sp. XN79A]